MADAHGVDELTESISKQVTLTAADAVALQGLGRRLASSTSWWGTTDDGEEPSERTVISVRPAGGDQWDVRVSDAVGAIAAGTTQFLVQPKIPSQHLLYLFSKAQMLPRLDPQRLDLASGMALWELVARWFVETTEALLRRDLIRDYHEHVDTFSFVRGRVAVLPTTRALFEGRIAIECEYDEFDADNALNRLLLAAAMMVTASVALPQEVRQRSRRIALRFDGVSDLQPGDVRATTDRRTHYYRDPIALAKAVLAGRGRTLAAGPEAAWTFLIRTPELIEAGVRAVLAEGLAPVHVVTKKGVQVSGTTKTLNPDLVVDGGEVVGDVKYKLTDTDWRTGDLYQVVAFATAYRADRAAIVGFATGVETLPTLGVGDLDVRYFAWDARNTTAPEQAGEELVAEVREWLDAASATTVDS